MRPGQSSGGTNVYAHLASAGSKGMFHAAIGLSGSPNISMPQAVKEAQDTEMWLPRTPCANVSEHAEQLLHCLQTADAGELLRSIPPKYEVFTFADKYDYPVNKVGLRTTVATLVHVDGVTITDPLEESLRRGLHSDVPIIFQSTQAEMDCYPIPSLVGASREQLHKFWDNSFSPAVFGSEMSSAVAAHYSNYTAIDPEYAVYAVDADTASTCGLLALSRAAAAGLKSPVYLATVTGAPSAAFSRSCSGMAGGMNTSRFPFHNWDLASAAAVYAGDKSCAATSADYTFGVHVKRSWMVLIEGGSLEGVDGWCRFRSGAGTAMDASVVNADTDSEDSSPSSEISTVEGLECSTVLELTGAKAVRRLKTDVCAWWERQGIGRNWWWIN
jgi:carboxylesterase type B